MNAKLWSAPFSAALLISSAALALPPGGAPEQGAEPAPHPQAAIGFTGDASSLPKAVAAAEAQTGGKVVEIRYHDQAGQPDYTAVIDRDGTLAHARIDARSFAVTSVDQGHIDGWMRDWGDRRDLRRIERARTPLAKAIATAEGTADGPAIDASLARDVDPTSSIEAYNVEVVAQGKPVRYAIDANTDEVIADPAALRDWAP